MALARKLDVPHGDASISEVCQVSILYKVSQMVQPENWTILMKLRAESYSESIINGVSRSLSQIGTRFTNNDILQKIQIEANTHEFEQT